MPGGIQICSRLDRKALHPFPVVVWLLNTATACTDFSYIS
uniref:Uncharacterized protein n=1 Tax=Anser brachyrhynchus TaxID=132585 RepID=A0A8B9CB84_9AVES